MSYRFTASLWLYPGDAGWHFVTLPLDTAEEIAECAGPVRRGFGSVRVSVTVGKTIWETSIFPDKKAASYVLPIKKQVRTAEHLEVGDDVAVTLEVEGTRGR